MTSWKQKGEHVINLAECIAMYVLYVCHGVWQYFMTSYVGMTGKQNGEISIQGYVMYI